MKPGAVLNVFGDAVAAVRVALHERGQWGHSGNRPDQYDHDVTADAVLLPLLHDAGFATLSEESGWLDSTSHPGAAVTVVVDPVDGSTNASRGLPWYATSLCAVDASGPWVALVTNLAIGESFAAIRGDGAWRTDPAGQRHALTPRTPSGLDDAIIAVSGLPPSHAGWEQFRAYGASALDLCSVAAGRFDAFIDIDAAHGVWDYLGAVLICQEAGVSTGEGQGQELCVLEHAARRAPLAAATPALLREIQHIWASWQNDPARLPPAGG